MLAIVAGGGAFAACTSPEDPVSGPAGGESSGIAECAVTASCSTGRTCSTTTTTCSTTTTTCGTTTTTTSTSTSTSTPLTTTLSCPAQINSGACVAGTTISCFDGPAGALVAPCAAGTSSCAADTSGYEACVGEIIQHPDACDFASAWSCGASPSTCGPGLFAQAFAGSGDESATSIGLDAARNLVVAGDSTSTDLQFGTIDVHLGGTGGFVAKLDAGRQPLWALAFEGASSTMAAVDPSGAVYVAGTFDGSLRVGSSVLQAGAHRSVFASKLSPSGSVVWISRLDQSGSAVVNAITVAPSGARFLAGSYAGKTTRVAGTQLPNSSDTSGLVIKLDPLDGSAIWVRSLRVTGDLSLRAIAADAEDDVYVVGAMLDPAACDEHPFVGQISPANDVVWLRELGFPGTGLAVAVAVDLGAVVSGSVRGSLVVSGVATRAVGFISHLGATGQTPWTRALPDWEGHAIAVDDAGANVVAGISPAAGGAPGSGHVQKTDDEGRRFYDLAFVPTPLPGGSVASLDVEGLAMAPGVGVFLVGGLRGSATFGAGATPPSAASTTRLDPWIAALGP